MNQKKYPDPKYVRYLTEVKAIINDQIVYFAGPDILATSWTDAELFCKINGLGYCKVIGYLCEVKNDYLILENTN